MMTKNDESDDSKLRAMRIALVLFTFAGITYEVVTLSDSKAKPEMDSLDIAMGAFVIEHDCIAKAQKLSDCKSEIDHVTAIRGQ